MKVNVPRIKNNLLYFWISLDKRVYEIYIFSEESEFLKSQLSNSDLLEAKL